MDDSAPDDGLIFKRLAGGSLIKYPPVFSHDSENLYVLSDNIVYVYSTSTGEKLRILEGPKNKLVNIIYDLLNPKLLIGCSISGEITKWKWKTGVIESKTQIQVAGEIRTFHVLNIDSECTYALITYVDPNTRFWVWLIMDIIAGKKVSIPFACSLREGQVLIDVDNTNFNYFVMAQGYVLHVVDFKTWRVKRWHNSTIIKFSCVRVHPTEKTIITGDKIGRIFLWRNIFAQNAQPKTTIYHWHHTPITSLSFTETGSGFYSSGQEAVLVKWNIDNQHLKEFLPRMSSYVVHVVVSYENKKVAVCLADNGIQIVGMQNQVSSVLQNFTFVHNMKTGLNKFPVGLELNPRTNSLVLNGRNGHLQFFSTYSQSLLYNMDIVLQNPLSIERNKILYDIHVTCAAFNINWMTTGEIWDDCEHVPELRLKFWEFDKKNNTYALNTNIEIPHEVGFISIKFSQQNESNNLLCGTAGKDNIIKIWTLEDSPHIHKKGKIWFCTAQTSYKSYILKSINFSQDGSLLSAAYGNSLCVYKPENLKLKIVLCSPLNFDGSLQKIKVAIPKKKLNGASVCDKNDESASRKKRIIDLFKRLLETNDSAIINVVKNNTKKPKRNSISSECSVKSLNKTQQEELFKKIFSINELNLFQKFDLYQKLGLYCKVPKEAQNRLLKYITKNVLETERTQHLLSKNVKKLSISKRFKAKYKLAKYSVRKIEWHLRNKQQETISILDLLRIDGVNNQNDDTKKQNGFAENTNMNVDDDNEHSNELSKEHKPLPPVQSIATIRHVVYGTGEFAHLVVVCTEHRVLIWNLLTLRLQSTLKLSVEHIAVDKITSLCAVFTTNNELYVFLPNTLFSVCHRTNMPKIHAAAWVPRRSPKSQSLSLDWQSASTLYFLTDKQELMCLVSERDMDSEGSCAEFLNEPHTSMNLSTFGAYAINQINQANRNIGSKSNQTTIGVPGKAAVKSLIESATHTMAPGNLVSKSFLKSLLIIDDSQKITPTTSSSMPSQDEDIEIPSDESDDDGEYIKKKHETKTAKINALKNNKPAKSPAAYLIQESILRKIANEKIDLCF